MLPSGVSVSLDLRIFYGMALAIPLEGLGSLCYHICPSLETFQFDAAFMLPIAHMSMFALINMQPIDVMAANSGVSAETLLAQRPSGKKGNGIIIGAAAVFIPCRNKVECASSQVVNSISGRVDSVTTAGQSGLPLKYFLAVLCPMWSFSSVGTWFDLGLVTSSATYACFAIIFGAWAFGVIASLSRFFPDDRTAVRRLQILLGTVVGITLLVPQVRTSLGGTANVNLILSIVAMAVVTSRHIVTHDLSRNSKPKDLKDLLKLKAKYCVALLFIIVANLAIGFFASKVSDVTVTPGSSRAMNAPCLLLGAFDAHDTWHLLSALSLSLWVMALLDMKIRMFKRCIWLPPRRRDLAVSESFSTVEDVMNHASRAPLIR